jgi:Carboxypeptidase regulatory-like domain
MRMARWCAVLVAIGLGLSAAPRSAVPQTAWLEGRVVDAISGLPVRGVVVRANAWQPQAPSGSTAAAYLTGLDGRFVFRDLPAGGVGLFATKTGYLSSDDERVGLAPGGRRDDVKIVLTPEGTISGQITDQYGDPIPGITVRATPQAEVSRFGRGESALTDDTGRYLVGGLPAGLFIVSVQPVNDGTPFGRDPVYFPSASKPDDATVIDVAPGIERGGVNLTVTLRAATLVVQTRAVKPGVSLGTASSLSLEQARGSSDSMLGSVAGVVKDTSGRGLPLAMVIMRRATGAASVQGVSTDESGRFQFDNVPPGPLRLAATKRGFQMVASPADTVPSETIPWVEVELSSSQRRNDVALVLSRTTVVSGTLLDHLGDPLSGSLSLRPSAAPNALRHSARTNSRGEFRISDVSPGEYILVVDQNPYGSPLRVADGSAQEREVAFLPVFYPGVPDASMAAPLAVRAGVDVAGLVVVVQPAPVSSIHVTIDPGARAAQNVLLTRTPLDGPPATSRATMSRDGLRGALDSVPAGRSLIVATATEVRADPLERGSDHRLWATAEIATDGTTPATLTMMLEPGARVSGRIVVEGRGLSSAAVQPRLEPASDVVGGAYVWPRELTGDAGRFEFTITNVQPGAYLLGVGARAESEVPWTVKSIVADGREIQQRVIDLAPGTELGNVIVTLSDQLTELSGTVVDERGRVPSGAGVIAFTPNPQLWRAGSSLIRSAVVDPTGRYVIPGLLPGEYRLAAVADRAAVSTADYPMLLARLLPSAVTITLRHAEQKVQDLRLRAPVVR